MKFDPKKDQKLGAFLNFFRSQSKETVDVLYSSMKDAETEFKDMIQMTKKLDQVYHELTSKPTFEN